MTTTPRPKPTTGILLEWKGQHCGNDEKRALIARTQEEWKEIFALVSAGNPPPPAPPMPKDKMAVAIFVGQVRRDSDALIYNVATGTDRVTIDWYEKTKPGTGIQEVMYEPYVIRMIDKTDLPVTFNEIQDPALKPASPVNLKGLRPR